MKLSKVVPVPAAAAAASAAAGVINFTIQQPNAAMTTMSSTTTVTIAAQRYTIALAVLARQSIMDDQEGKMGMPTVQIKTVPGHSLYLGYYRLCSV
mmetsp:Transcript_13192/g.22333  ORF Transcript_13192/g.22333 Transcript_13192/m.22333 type:complete len:96 (-) Transcript_13192:209-496(-)